MEHIKASTKKGQNLLRRAKHNEGEYLSDVYGRYSSAKEDGYRYCRDLCKEVGGENFRIVSHNCDFFSVAFDTDTHVYVITVAHDYCIELNA